MPKVEELSRRKFLRGAGTSLAGLALAGGVGLLLPGCSQQPAPPPAQPAAAEPPKAPEWPFTYTKLDPDKALKLAYDSYQDDNG
jgi:hypothetical protein